VITGKCYSNINNSFCTAYSKKNHQIFSVNSSWLCKAAHQLW